MANARLLWVGYSYKEDSVHVEVLKVLRQRELIEFCVATGGKPEPIGSSILDEPVISHKDAQFANYEEINPFFNQKIDRLAYSIFSSFEGETLRMMDRLYKRREKYWINDDSFDFRRKKFLRHCSFWLDYIQSKRITNVLFNGVPHEIYTFVILKIAEHLNIPTLILHHEKIGTPRKIDGILYGKHYQRTVHREVFHVSENLADIGNWSMSQKINETAKFLGAQLIHGDPLGPLFEVDESNLNNSAVVLRHSSTIRFFKEVIKVFRRPPPAVVPYLSPARSNSILGSFGGRFREIKIFIRRANKSRIQRREHLRIACTADEKKNTVIYFLSCQPEESSSPRGDIFCDQYYAIEGIARSLPEGWALRVREHPDQYGKRIPRSDNYLRNLTKLPQVSIVPLGETVAQSFSNVKAAAGIAGTSCVESWVRKVPLLLFGDMILKKAPGVFFIETLPAIVSALERVRGGFSPSENEIDAFKEWSSNHSYTGSLGRIYGDPTFRGVTINNLEAIISSWFYLTYTNL